MPDASIAAFAPPAPARRDVPGPASSGGRCDQGARVAGRAFLLAVWLHRIRERRRLERIALEYPTYLLRDVGLRREDLLREACKPFWRA
jgi:uncharacterized protein YjiS (DUF1127 family)